MRRLFELNTNSQKAKAAPIYKQQQSIALILIPNNLFSLITLKLMIE